MCKSARLADALPWVPGLTGTVETGQMTVAEGLMQRFLNTIWLKGSEDTTYAGFLLLQGDIRFQAASVGQKIPGCFNET